MSCEPPSKLSVSVFGTPAGMRYPASVRVGPGPACGCVASVRAASSAAKAVTDLPPTVNVSGTRRTTSSGSPYTLRVRMLLKPTANCCARVGRIDSSRSSIPPSTSLPARPALLSVRRNSRSKPCNRLPSGSPSNGMLESSIERWNTTSVPITRAPPSMTAVKTRAISGVQRKVAESLKGGVR